MSCRDTFIDEVSSRTIPFALAGALLLAGSFLAPTPATAQDSVPVLNIEPSCRAAAAASIQGNLDEGYRACLQQENSARVELEKQWRQFARSERASCLGMTQELGGTSASYVELLECMTMARDAADMDKSGSKRTTGQGQ